MQNIVLPQHPDNVIENYREVNAHIHTVYKAITVPEHLSKWWGPNGFTNTFNEYDFRVGGKWDFIMHGPDGTNYHNESIFVKIEEPELVVFNHISAPQFQAVIQLKEIDGHKTEVNFKQVFETPEACQKLKAFCLEKNEENLDRLEAELANIK